MINTLHRIFGIGLMIVASLTSHAESGGKDSLWQQADKILGASYHDSTHVQSLLEIAEEIVRFDGDMAKLIIRKTIPISDEIEFRSGISRGYNLLGKVNFHLGLYDSAHYYLDRKLDWLNDLEEGEKRNKNSQASVIANHAVIYTISGDYEKAMKSYIDALQIHESLGDSANIMHTLNNLAALYSRQGDYDKTLSASHKVRKYYEHKGEHNSNLLNAYINIGLCYDHFDKLDSARMFHNKALDLGDKLNRPAAKMKALNGLGYYYYAEGDLKKSNEYYSRSLKIIEDINSPREMAQVLNHLGHNYEKLGEYRKAIAHLERANEIALEIGEKQFIANTYNNLAEAYHEVGEYRKAYMALDKYTAAKDSILNRQKLEQMAEMEEKYESEKKGLEIKALARANELKDARIERDELEAEKKDQMLWTVGVGLVIAIGFGGLAFAAFRRSKKANKVIDMQRKEAEDRRQVIETKNREIVDSINYAKQLQEAILPPLEHMEKSLPESFIIYWPKDIVAGDFYWMETYASGGASVSDGNTVYIAAADCTGHGVPGAMVSVVCSNALSKALIEEGITDTGKLLDRARELVIAQFSRESSLAEASEDREEIKDGMDISLVAIRHDRKQVRWSGANNPLWIVKGGGSHPPAGNRSDQKPIAADNNDQLLEIKPDKQPIGKYAHEDPFTQHTIDLEEGDTLYLFSDGYVDQFGGPKGKKYKSTNLKKLLLSIQNETLKKQKEILAYEFESWKGRLEQVDDVCMIGIRF